MNQNERKTVMRRMILLIGAAALVMGLYVLRLIFLQLVNGDSYKSRATNTTDYNFTVTAARGDIVDSTGKRIATTTTSYNIIIAGYLNIRCRTELGCKHKGPVGITRMCVKTRVIGLCICADNFVFFSCLIPGVCIFC